MPLVPKEVIRPGSYFYTDEKTGEPRKLVVTKQMCQHWHDEGNKMIGLGLTVPVPYEHDFSAHPMAAADKLKNNAGWVQGYEIRGNDGALWSKVDIQDDDVARKLPRTVRWTSPWINSFTDGDGRKWDNVISHLALTTRPRIVRQEPFGSIAAALSLAKPENNGTSDKGMCLSRAGLLRGHGDGMAPAYPLAFSMWAGGVSLASDTFPPKKKKKGKDTEQLRKTDANPTPSEQDSGAEPDSDDEDDIGSDTDSNIDSNTNMDATTSAPPAGAAAPPGTTPPAPGAPGAPAAGDPALTDPLGGLINPLQDSGGDVQMEELLCDLLQALGVPMPDESNEQEFKRHLYEAVMSKIKELTSHGMAAQQTKPPDPGMQPPNQNKPPAQQPNASKAKQPNNPLMPQVQQEQQPMYMSHGSASNGGVTVSAIMSLEEINAIQDPTMKTVALSMYRQNEELRARLESSEKIATGIRDAKLAEESGKRAERVKFLGRIGGPRVQTHLQAMISQQSMALSLGGDGQVVDPMKATLDTLEAGLQNLPALLQTDTTGRTIVPQPQDGDALSIEGERELVDSFSRMMGGEPERQAS